MRVSLAAAFVLAVSLVANPALALKRVPYPEVRVVALPAFDGDVALADMRKRFADAVAAQNLAAVTILVSPKFEWTAAGGLVDEFDAKRGAEHNFKVAFGFRAPGRDADGTTDIGPQWELLAFFATDPVLTQEKGSPLVCGTTTAKVEDMGALDAAFNRIDEENDLSEWVYFVGELELTAKPGAGASVAKVSSLALPIVDLHPSAKEGSSALVTPTHFELLLPNGKAGWAPVERARPLFVDRLCFAKLGNEWKIAAYEQAE
ncbi:MAG TPA: hypothetical protein VFY21_02975 [Xanthobacteraceae bacterium]|nr:hypothetical protein [Xanthobacteraceae bacterium]